MTDTTYSAKDAGGVNRLFTADLNGDGHLTPYHLIESAQYAAILAALVNASSTPDWDATGLPPVTGGFTATGQSASFAPKAGRPFNVRVSAVDGTVQLERQLPGEGGFTAVTDNMGTPLAWTAAVNCSFSEPETGVNYRLNCTAYTSGTITYRISQ